MYWVRLVSHRVSLTDECPETLRPQDFLDFRELLYPASGFQSYQVQSSFPPPAFRLALASFGCLSHVMQFRLIENKLGLFAERTYENKPVYYYLKEEHQKDIRNSAHEASLVYIPCALSARH